MVTFLVLQIKMGNITIDDVPEKYKEAVLKLLESGEKYGVKKIK